jgi:Tol biopolymer transport system component
MFIDRLQGWLKPTRAITRSRPHSQRLHVEPLEDRLVPSTVRTITYDQITALPSSTVLNGDSPFNVLSANGNRAVFQTSGPSGDQIYTVKSDGSGLTLVDPNTNNSVGGHEVLDISANGAVVLETLDHGNNGKELRVVNADGSNQHDALTVPYTPSIATRLSPDGQTVFFEDISSFTLGSQTYTPGLYAVAAAGGIPQLIASDAQVATLLGTTASNITMGPAEGIDLDVSSDGQHLVFGAARNNVGEFLLGVNRDGSGLHTIGPLPGAPGVGVSEAGISGDGSTVFRYDTSSALPAPRLTVYHFDGSDSLTLNVPNGLYALTTGPEHVQLTQDGSMLLLGTSSLLINTDNSGVVQIGTDVGLSGYGLVNAQLYHPTLNSSGTEFLFTFRDVHGAFQLSVGHLNPSGLGSDPAISNLSISPSYLLTETRSATTIRAAVSGSTTPVGVSEAFLRGGVSEAGYFTDTPLYNDGTHGSTAGSSTYTNNGITINYDPPTGPRTVRVSAETVDGNGLQHVTAVEVSGLTVVTQAPVPLSGTFVLGLDQQVYAQLFDANGNPSSGYFLASAGQVQTLEVGQDGSGRPEVFALGFDNQVYVLKLDASGHAVGPYLLAHTGEVRSFSVSSDAAGNPELFVLGFDSQVYALKLDATGSPVGGYVLTHAGQVKSFTVGHDASNHPELFALGTDNQIYAQKFDANGSSVSGYFLTSPGRVQSLIVGSDGSGRPELFVLGLDNQVYAQKLDASGSSASAYFLLGPGAVKALAVGNGPGGLPEVFVIGLDNQVYGKKLDAGGNPVSAYFLTRPGAVKALAVGHDSLHDSELFVIGLDDQVYGQKFDSNGSSASNYFFAQPGRVKSLDVTR